MKRILVSLILIAVVASFVSMGAMAVFSDQETSSDNTFSTGTLVLGIDPATAIFTVSSMAPGDVTYSGLQVSNSGSLELRYAMATTPDGTSILDEQLDLTIDVVTGAGLDTIWYTADDVVGIANIYGPDGTMSSAAIGNPTQGEQAGDRILASSASEKLRFKVTLPLATDDTYQGTTCIVAFVFGAEQTVNNP